MTDQPEPPEGVAPAQPPARPDLAPEALDPRLGSELAATEVTRPRPDETPVERPPEPLVLRGVAVTPFRLLAAATSALGVIAVLLGLMVFAPRIAPIKLGATRLAAEAQTNEQVTEVAKRFATNFLSLDYRTVDADFDRVVEDTTGNFERQLRRLLDVTKDRLIEAKGISEGRVTRLSVLSRTEDSATVQVMVSRSIQNADNPEPRVVPQTIEVTLVFTAGGWKVDHTTGIPPATSGDR
ncbi:MAG: hypothetical protein ACRDKJ_12255 [Actinomycetota bacterium]